MPKLKLVPDDLTGATFEAVPQGAVQAAADALLDPTRQTRCETCRTLCLPYC